VDIAKCQFHQKSIEFLGYILAAEGVSMAQDKLQAVKEWAKPKNVRDMQSFLGFANFYRQFIKGFSDICKPLTEQHKEVGKFFKWSGNCKRAFEKLRLLFVEASILRHFDPNL
jgi:hypothetical protein